MIIDWKYWNKYHKTNIPIDPYLYFYFFFQIWLDESFSDFWGVILMKTQNEQDWKTTCAV